MKKLLLVLAIGAFAACNDSATSTDSAVDSTTTTTIDSVQVKSDTSVMHADSTAVMDSVHIKADSAK